MKVLYTTDLSRTGNDCYIYESVSLIEAFGMYKVITAQKIVGWAEREDIYTYADITTDLQQAKFWFKKAGGIIEEE